MRGKRCQDLLQSLLEFSCQPEFAEQMEVARELFAVATGKVNDDDTFYESRMAIFQEYFVFDYRLSEIFSGATIFETFLLNSQAILDVKELHEYEQFRSMRRSLFVVEKFRPDSVVVTDLFSLAQEVVYTFPDFTISGLDTEQVFEGRLLFFEDRQYFTGNFVFHPKEVRLILEKMVKEFLRAETYQRAAQTTNWREELRRRHSLLAKVAEQKRELELSDKKRSIDVLKISQRMLDLAQETESPGFVMALGQKDYVSPFVPETAFYDQENLVNYLSYCEIRSVRYRHIDPRKIYSFENAPFRVKEPAPS